MKNSDSKAENVTENPKNKDKRYRKYVPTEEKLKLISDFMNCNFQNYTDVLASQVSRQFVFKLPEYALGTVFENHPKCRK